MIQIPIIDLRHFLSGSTGRLRRPWPVGLVDPRPGCSQFVRGFGELQTTAQAETRAWEGRAQHVDASRVLRWPPGFAQAVREQMLERGGYVYGWLGATCRARTFYGSQTSARNFLQILVEPGRSNTVSAISGQSLDLKLQGFPRLPDHRGSRGSALRNGRLRAHKFHWQASLFKGPARRHNPGSQPSTSMSGDPQKHLFMYLHLFSRK